MTAPASERTEAPRGEAKGEPEAPPSLSRALAELQEELARLEHELGLQARVGIVRLQGAVLRGTLKALSALLVLAAALALAVAGAWMLARGLVALLEEAGLSAGWARLCGGLGILALLLGGSALAGRLLDRVRLRRARERFGPSE